VAVIEIRGVSKAYRRLRRPPHRAVSSLDLQVPEGGVFGFLGPNGSGKTTTIRLLLGLVRPDGGEMRLLGRPVPEQLADAVPEVGALVETPLFFPAFSGRRNLKLLAGIAGVPDARVDEVLEQVGLADRKHDRVKTYSLGMKQRLGIAAALLKKPRLLILDEPSNGLDPAGIREIREMMRRLGAAGITIFVSSHLLNEVEQMCDSVAILAKGRLVTSGPVREVLASRATGEVRVGLADLAAGETALREAGFAVTAAGDHLLVAGVPDPAVLTRTLARHELWASELTPVTANLESVFLDLTETPRDVA
jgi:ABC-2 type transport system ATP-binding protein